MYRHLKNKENIGNMSKFADITVDETLLSGLILVWQSCHLPYFNYFFKERKGTILIHIKMREE
jgi:hypothetical protein